MNSFVPLHDAISQFLTAKRAAGRRSITIKNLRVYLTRFSWVHEGKSVHEITVADIEEALQRERSAWGRSTALNLFSSFFSFAVRRGWRQENPCRRVERITIEQRPPRILTVDEARRLLEAADPKCRPWIVLGLFAGLRPSEAERLDWSAIRLTGDSPCVVVDAAASKVRRRRIVPLPPVAVAWLALDAREAGPIVSCNATLRRARGAAAKAAGVQWSQDVLRHSCASYRLGAGHPIDRVASELGNSPSILLRHYRELVTVEDAAKFWALLP